MPEPEPLKATKKNPRKKRREERKRENAGEGRRERRETDCRRGRRGVLGRGVKMGSKKKKKWFGEDFWGC